MILFIGVEFLFKLYKKACFDLHIFDISLSQNPCQKSDCLVRVIHKNTPVNKIFIYIELYKHNEMQL